MIRSQNFIHLESRLIKQVGTTVVEYNMIEENDHVLVCLSGGKGIGTKQRVCPLP